VVGIVANQREVVTALSCPLVESSLDILGSANFEQDCFFVLCIWNS
jgi:hypothetical protein